ncbi:ABC transporter substrate-binding protein [Motiliproteus sp. SC1-56]|uniref:ABC transporter substrate-binding protein n=1 Tax=Motiliproteus sp. SC1-56 TaxID=2799565 RepID=UPI001A900625|nr:ABC transporter substrate-binding protein [Motiliproteus sp. SC1-56]
MNRTWPRLLVLLMQLGLVASCAQPEPVQLGFIGELSGRGADMGLEARNGAVLAVEEQNQTGGVDGRSLNLLIEDDGRHPETARQAFNRLRSKGVVAILGPTSSAIARVLVPQANETALLLMGITVAPNELTEADDYFFSALSSTKIYARRNAQYVLQHLNARRLSIAYDRGEQAFTRSWTEDFSRHIADQGGEVLTTVPFDSSNATGFSNVARQLLTPRPDGVVLVAKSVDTALLAKSLRTLNPDIPISTTEWGGTERLIKLGGRYVEGMLVAQLLQRDSSAPYFLAFQEAYRERFGDLPGFAATTGYNATRVLIEGLKARRSGEHLKDTLLRIGTFRGLQAPLAFDRFGNATTKSYPTLVRQGRFVPLE